MSFTDWLESHDQRRTVLLEIDYTDGGVPGTLYVSSRPFTSYPTDTPSNVPYDDVILSGLEYTRGVSDNGDYRARVSSVRLAASPEMLTARSYEFARQPVRVYLGDERWTRSQFNLIATLTAQGLKEISRNVLELELLATSVDVDQVINDGSFASGDNSGKTLPVLFGDCLNVQPVKNDTAGLEWKLHDQAITSVSEIRDGGSVISGTVDAANAKITLSSAPAGILTVDALGTSTNLRDVLNDLLDRLGVASRDTAAINALPNPSVSLYSPNSLTYRQAFDALLGSVGGFWGFTRLGVFTAGIVELPIGTPDELITPDDIELDGVKFLRRIVPATEVAVLYDVNHTVQDNRLEAGRYSRTTNPGIENTYPDATVREVQTILRGTTHGDNESSRRALLFSAAHRVYKIQTFAIPFNLNVGDVVTIEYPHFGLEQGLDATILSITDSPLTGRTTLEVLFNGSDF